VLQISQYSVCCINIQNKSNLLTTTKIQNGTAVSWLGHLIYINTSSSRHLSASYIPIQRLRHKRYGSMPLSTPLGACFLSTAQTFLRAVVFFNVPLGRPNALPLTPLFFAGSGLAGVALE
jgi:hypothetical protein